MTVANKYILLLNVFSARVTYEILFLEKQSILYRPYPVQSEKTHKSWREREMSVRCRIGILSDG